MGLINYLFGWMKYNIKRGDLVLEVGSGGRPFARSNVLVEMFIEDSSERHVAQLVADRPIVCANGEELPFKDNSFDFFISAHVLEHVLRPELFLEEAMRVSQRGLIITPSAFCEKVLPLSKHLWLVEVDEKDVLILNQKSRANECSMPGVLHEAWLYDPLFRRFFNSRPDLFEVRFQYDERFTYQVERQVVRPEWLLKASLEEAAASDLASSRVKLRSKLRSLLSSIVRKIESGNKTWDLDSLLACPVCHGSLVYVNKQTLQCQICNNCYAVRPDGIPILLA